MAAARPAWIAPIALCCLFAILFLIAATIVLALIPIYLPAKDAGFANNQTDSTLSAGFATNAVGAASDSIANSSALLSQLNNQPGVAGQAIVTGANFIPQRAAARRKRQTLNANGIITCETTTGLTGDILVVQYQLIFRRGCARGCQRRFRNNFIALLRRNYQQFIITVNFVIAGVKQVTCAFCGVFDSGIPDCTPDTRTYAYLADLSNNLYQFNPTSLTLTSLGTIACSTSSSLYSIAVQRNGLLYAAFTDGSLFRYNIQSKACTATTLAGNQTGFAPYTITFLKSTTSNSETLYASQQTNTSAALATINTNTLALSTVGTYSNGLATYADNAGTNDGRLFGVFETNPYTIAQINPANAAILAQYPLNVAPPNNDPNYGFTVLNTRFFFFEGNGSFSNLYTYDLGANTTTFHFTIPQVINSATASSCLGT